MKQDSVSMTSWKAQAPAALVVPGSIGDSVPLHMTPQPDSLMSPVDPSFLKGASSLARFGLDIGGTLCKVVFFEPVVADEAHPAETPKSRLSRTSFEDEDNVVPASDASCANDHHECWEGEGKEDASMCKRSRPTPRVFNKSGMTAGQARKMWVSSHDPVHIPGRGTLYFKCFGVSHISCLDEMEFVLYSFYFYDPCLSLLSLGNEFQSNTSFS